MLACSLTAAGQARPGTLTGTPDFEDQCDGEAWLGLAWHGLARLGLARLVTGRVLVCASRQRNRLGRRHLAWPLEWRGLPPPNGLGPLRLSIMIPPACTRPAAPAHLHKGAPGPARLRHKVARSPTRARGLPQRASDARLNSLTRTHTSDLAYMWLAAGAAGGWPTLGASRLRAAQPDPDSFELPTLL